MEPKDLIKLIEDKGFEPEHATLVSVCEELEIPLKAGRGTKKKDKSDNTLLAAILTTVEKMSEADQGELSAETIDFLNIAVKELDLAESGGDGDGDGGGNGKAEAKAEAAKAEAAKAKKEKAEAKKAERAKAKKEKAEKRESKKAERKENSRISIACEVLQEGGTKAELIEKSNKLYVERSGREANLRITKNTMWRVLTTAECFGILELSDKGVYSLSFTEELKGSMAPPEAFPKSYNGIKE